MEAGDAEATPTRDPKKYLVLRPHNVPFLVFNIIHFGLPVAAAAALHPSVPPISPSDCSRWKKKVSKYTYTYIFRTAMFSVAVRQ